MGEQSIVEIPEKEALMIEVRKLLKKGKASKSGQLEVKVVTVYLRTHFKPAQITEQLTNAVKNSGIWQLLHAVAMDFIEKNRSSELELFKEMYPTELPRDCFINLNDVGFKCGIHAHRDHVSFCTIVVCLEGKKMTL